MKNETITHTSYKPLRGLSAAIGIGLFFAFTLVCFFAPLLAPVVDNVLSQVRYVMIDIDAWFDDLHNQAMVILGVVCVTIIFIILYAIRKYFDNTNED